MKMFRIYITIVVFLCIGCELDFTDNKRLLFKGSLVDESEKPLPNLPVRIIASSTSTRQSFREVLGNGFTDENGIFNILTLSPTNGNITVDINSNSQIGFIADRATYRILGFRSIDEVDATYTIPKLRVERLIDSQLEIKRITMNTDTLFYEFRTKPSEKQLNLDFSESLDNEIPDFFSPFGTVLPTDNEIREPLLKIPAEDTIQFRYTFSSRIGEEVLSKELIIDSESNSYVFEF